MLKGEKQFNHPKALNTKHCGVEMRKTANFIRVSM